MAPTPVSFKLERIDFVPHVAPELRAARPPVFYARTRALAEAGEAGYYRDARDQHLRLGGARGKCWSFPPDYERCLEEALLGQFPQLRRAR